MRNRPGVTPATTNHETEPTYLPQTKLGGVLWQIRGQIVASGEPLLSWEDIEQELDERRHDARAQE
jgi:hypothetical protein